MTTSQNELEVNDIEKVINSAQEAIDLETAVASFYTTRERLYRERDEAIRRAALVLSQRQICWVTGLSPETIRQITRGHPTSWRKPATSDRETK